MNTSVELTRKQLAVARYKCDKDLLFFTRFFYKVLMGTRFITNWHHEKITESLHKVENYELEILNINIPPRFSKTELAAVNFIARGIGMNPKGNYLYITSSDELRAETSVRIRDIVSHPYFQIMYGVTLKKDQNGKNLWRTSDGGGLKTATIFGQITGFGAGQMIEHDLDDDTKAYLREFEGSIVLDDINKIDDTGQMNATNAKVTRVIFNTVLSRKNSKDTPIINIQQRAGETDATAEFMEHYKGSDRAEFLIMPIITDGVPLWNWKHDVDSINKLKDSPKTAHVFETQYMQNPQPLEGLLYDLKYYDELPHEDGAISLGAADIADSGLDYLSAPFGKLIGDKVFITDAVYTQESSATSADKLAMKSQYHNVMKLICETNAMGATYITLLKSKGAQNVKGVVSTGGKMNRLIGFAWIINEHFVFKRTGSEEYMNFLKAVKGFLKSATKEDDAPDSLTILAKYVYSNYKHIFRNN